MYELRFTPDAAGFLATAGDRLARQPVLSTVIATIADRAVAEDAEGIQRDPDRPWWFVTIVDHVGLVDHARDVDHDGEIVGTAMRTAPGPDHALWVTEMPPEAAVQLAHALHDRGEFAGAMNGSLPATRLMAEESARLWGKRAEIRSHTRLYELDTLTPPVGVGGTLRAAVPADLELLNNWLTIFGAEAAEQGDRPAPELVEHDRDETSRRIRDGRLWVWEVDGRPVHVTGANLPSLGVARIGPVLTPKEYRGHGYAAAAVAGVSRRLLDLDARVCLFTDQANPVSNKLYQRLGYRPVVDMANFGLS
ncbi:GNAT family N-acetyltransferase [Microlunatus soli]|uniref:Predicted acetyltransferase, GNAT family n=1 Tax=Microlunatus soli TaxID=630515 RepID=A0A1H1Z8M4_9ACTN|nr:GNAT family N-acetyltransferase [Microlunatus soli]SDT30131.1 Predicted acetyltransferase, GNAT family [Microlunatus soli]